MKLTKYIPQFGPEAGNSYNFIILETMDDLEIYQNSFLPISAKSFVKNWFDFNQSTKSTFRDYVSHLGSTVKAEQVLMGFELEYIHGNKNIVEICQMFDNILYKKLEGIRKQISEGKIIRINKNGGYCDIDAEEIKQHIVLYTVDSTADNRQLNSFLLNSKFEVEKMDLNHNSILIENDESVDPVFLSTLSEMNLKNIKQITNFNNLQLIIDEKDFVAQIIESRSKGYIKNICFNTTVQNENQILFLNKILNVLDSKNLANDINIYVNRDSFPKVKSMLKGRNVQEVSF